MVWELRIDDLGGPFASSFQKRVAHAWENRCNFQASYRFKKTQDDDLEDGDAIVEALYDSWHSSKGH
jgi:hypothetical protein